MSQEMDERFLPSRIEAFRRNDLSRRVSRLTCLLRRHATPRRKHDRESRFAILRPTSEFRRGVSLAYARLMRSPTLDCFSPPVRYVASRCFFFFFLFPPAPLLLLFFGSSWERARCASIGGRADLAAAPMRRTWTSPKRNKLQIRSLLPRSRARA